MSDLLSHNLFLFTVDMYSRPCLAAMRFRLSSQIRLRSEPSTSRENPNQSNRHRHSFVEAVLKGHSKAVEEMESEIVMREEMRKKDLRNSENLLLNTVLPYIQSKVISNSRFVPVGSSVTGLASSHSDLDVVLFPTDKKSRGDFVKKFTPNEGLRQELLSVLRSTIVHSIHNWEDDRFEVEDCHIFPSFKVPLLICQFTNGTSLDISIVDGLCQSIRNTHLMRQYAKSDDRVGRLLLWLKMWTTALEIRNSKAGLLSSYHLLLLVIHFLQSEQSLTMPVIPVLYQRHNDVFNKNRPIDDIVAELDEPPLKLDWTTRNTMSTAELVIRFFDYYSHINVLQKSIHIDKGMARNRTNLIPEQAAIYDPYSNQTAFRSLIALRAFRDAVLYTHRRMRSGFMLNPFAHSSDFSYEQFLEATESSEWRLASLKRGARNMKFGYHIRLAADG